MHVKSPVLSVVPVSGAPRFDVLSHHYTSHARRVATQHLVHDRMCAPHDSFLLQAEYIAADGYGFDYVIVFKAERAGVMTAYATETVKRIVAAGFEVRVYFSCSREEVFCEMRATVERLMQFADQVRTDDVQNNLRLSVWMIKSNIITCDQAQG